MRALLLITLLRPKYRFMNQLVNGMQDLGTNPERWGEAPQKVAEIKAHIDKYRGELEANVKKTEEEYSKLSMPEDLKAVYAPIY